MEVKPNIPPTIEITKPKEGDELLAWTTASLTSSVEDAEQAPRLEGVVVKWVSDVDGDIMTGSTAAPGIAGDSQKTLNPGAHTITATVTDPFGATATASVHINVTSKPPTASINYPPDGSTFYTSQNINLRGVGSSPSGALAPLTLTWDSSLDGALLTGPDVWVKLSEGSHVISLTAADPLGQSGQSSVTVTVKSGVPYPTAQIQTPQDYAMYRQNQPVNLQGLGTDSIDGTLSNSQLAWYSDVDGFLGNGASINVVLTGGACAPIRHTITLEVTNSLGNKSSHKINVLVGQIC
jgi:hypothetical protein